MIAVRNRFHGHNSLRFVYQNGKTDRGPMTALKYVANPRRDSYRLAVVVSKKVSKSAVVRNRIRRRIYEVVRKEPALTGKAYDMVITVFHEDVATVPHEDLQAMINTHLVQSHII